MIVLKASTIPQPPKEKISEWEKTWEYLEHRRLNYSKCSGCRKILSNDQFYKDSRRDSGRRYTCRECCSKSKAAAYRRNNPLTREQRAALKLAERQIGGQECQKCKTVKPLNAFSKTSARGKAYFRKTCRACQLKPLTPEQRSAKARHAALARWSR